LEVKIETDSNDAVEIKTEAGSNDIAEYPCDDGPSVGMFGLFLFVSHEFIHYQVDQCHQRHYILLLSYIFQQTCNISAHRVP